MKLPFAARARFLAIEITGGVPADEAMRRSRASRIAFQQA
jgi:hypothetical protein